MINWEPIQTKLSVTADGVAGPRTYGALFDYVANEYLGTKSRDLGVGASTYLNRFGIYTPLRLAHFLGQTCVETEYFRYLREIWGPTPAQNNYENNSGLGNVNIGDGKLFLGRGLIQITGRSNYEMVGKRVGIDLVSNPELAERPDIAVLTASDWWAAHGCNALADADERIKIGRLINCGNANSLRMANGEGLRIAATNRAKEMLL